MQDSFNVKLLIHPGNSSATFLLFSKENALSQPYFPTNFPAHSPAHRGVSLFRSDGEITRSLRGIIINLVKPPDKDAVPIDDGTPEICPKTLLLLLRNRTRQRLRHRSKNTSQLRYVTWWRHRTHHEEVKIQFLIENTFNRQGLVNMFFENTFNGA